MRAAKLLLGTFVVGLGLFFGVHLAVADETGETGGTSESSECDPSVAAALRSEVSSLQAQVAALQAQLGEAKAELASAQSAPSPAPAPAPAKADVDDDDDEVAPSAVPRPAPAEIESEEPAPSSAPTEPSATSGSVRLPQPAVHAPVSSTEPTVIEQTGPPAPEPNGVSGTNSSAGAEAVAADFGGDDQDVASAEWHGISAGRLGGTGTAPQGGSGNTLINAVNSSEDPKSRTGDAAARNDVRVGTVAGQNLTLDNQSVDSVTMTLVMRDLEIVISQVAEASTGDAMAGSQVIAAAGGGCGPGSATINALNVSEDAKARSGDADASNAVNFAEPLVANHLLANESAITGPVNQTIQIRDIEIEINQTANATTGAAVAGVQSIGVAGGGACNHTAPAGGVNVNAANRADDARARSGEGGTENDANVAAAQANDTAVLAIDRGPARAPAAADSGATPVAPASDYGAFALAVQAALAASLIGGMGLRRRLRRN